MFYSGEGAYNFQYLDLAPRKYAADAPWLEVSRGFTIDQASLVAKAVAKVHVDNADAIRERMRKLPPDEWTTLPLFAFAVADVAARADLAVDLVERILGAFQLPVAERNAAFKSVHDFNVVTATPLLRIPSGEFLSLQSYSLAEALYESPFYWMAQDKAYLPTLDKNRGDFTEKFAAERLALVFGAGQVHLNVDLFETKAAKVSDIDVLVVWGNRVVIVQAKSERLTLESRKGNDQSIRDDFKKAVQMAYDQGVACAKCLLDKRHKIVAAAYINLAAAGLYHAWEQHVLEFFGRYIVGNTHRHRVSAISLGEFKVVAKRVGIRIDEFPSARTIETQRLCANAVKHAEGSSALQLRERRPEFFVHPGVYGAELSSLMVSRTLYAPLSGDDLHVTEAHLDEFFAGTI